jgi:hypothetical protein
MFISCVWTLWTLWTLWTCPACRAPVYWVLDPGHPGLDISLSKRCPTVQVSRTQTQMVETARFKKPGRRCARRGRVQAVDRLRAAGRKARNSIMALTLVWIAQRVVEFRTGFVDQVVECPHEGVQGPAQPGKGSSRRSLGRPTGPRRISRHRTGRRPQHSRTGRGFRRGAGGSPRSARR